MSENTIFKAQRSSLRAALLCLAALTNACGGDDSTSTSHAIPIAGCETLDVTPCDTRARDCQLSRLEIAACLRQTEPGPLPIVTLLSEQNYVDYANATFAGTGLTGTNHFEVAMTWLGLTHPGSFGFVPLQTENVADWFGTYRWRQKELLLIDHGKPSNDEASNVELVASWIRMLRDRDTDIGAWSTVVSIFDVDSNWGGDAMFFGEGRFYSNRYQAALHGLDASRFDEFAQINDGIRDDIAWIRAQPSPYMATNTRFAHNFGARAAYLAWQRAGATGVNELYRGKLLTQQLMASEAEEGPAPPLKYHGRPRAPSEYVEDPIVTALGAWGLFLSLSRSLPTDTAWPLALDWRGDQIFVYEAGDSAEDTAIVWQIEMADEASASSLEEELTAIDPAARVGRNGTFVTLARLSNEASLDWAFVDD